MLIIPNTWFKCSPTLLLLQVDEEIQKLDRMDDDDLESMRRKRMATMKKMQDQKREWMTLGHGKYEEVPEEKDFFNIGKKSKNVICHFYRDGTFRCKILDKHLALLAPKHIEARFVKINADKCPFLTQRLRIKFIPTIMIVKDEKTVDYIVGFEDLGNTDEFSTEMLEWRIARSDVINYSGDLLTPPGASNQKKVSILGKKEKTIKGSRDDDSSDEDDWWSKISPSFLLPIFVLAIMCHVSGELIVHMAHICRN